MSPCGRRSPRRRAGHRATRMKAAGGGGCGLKAVTGEHSRRRGQSRQGRSQHPPLTDRSSSGEPGQQRLCPLGRDSPHQHRPGHLRLPRARLHGHTRLKLKLSGNLEREVCCCRRVEVSACDGEEHCRARLSPGGQRGADPLLPPWGARLWTLPGATQWAPLPRWRGAGAAWPPPPACWDSERSSTAATWPTARGAAATWSRTRRGSRASRTGHGGQPWPCPPRTHQPAQPCA